MNLFYAFIRVMCFCEATCFFQVDLPPEYEKSAQHTRHRILVRLPENNAKPTKASYSLETIHTIAVRRSGEMFFSLNLKGRGHILRCQDLVSFSVLGEASFPEKGVMGTVTKVQSNARTVLEQAEKWKTPIKLQKDEKVQV